jgi:DNA-binding ferritin-like protein
MKASYIPPQSVADNAQRALDIRAQKPPSHQGMTPVGLARANQLANRDPVSLDTIQRMVSYFERHEIDKQGETWDEQGKGWQAWNGWGGDEGREWANRILQENAVSTKASRRHSESDMKLIRKLRSTIKSAGDILVDLGDDGLEDGDTAGSADQTMDAKSIKSETCADAVRQILAESYFLSYKAHAAHWNTESLNFPQYHAFFESVYEDVESATDPLAEFIRALGYKAPSTIAELQMMVPADTMTENDSLEGMISSISDDNLRIINLLMGAIVITGTELEYGVQNYLQERLGYHQKLAWKLRSIRMSPADEIIPDLETPEMEMETEEIPAEMEMETAALEDRNATLAEREEMSDDDFVIPETRNFPVVTPDDIPAAVSSWGRYEGDITFEEFKSRLIALAQSKGPDFVSALPQEWLDELEDNAKSIRMLARRLLFGR